MNPTADKLRGLNPYPEDIFSEPTRKKKKLLRDFIKKNKLDGYMGTICRNTWNHCCDELEEIYNEN